MRYTYSRWDGSQDLGPLDVDALMGALSTDLLSDGDLEGALQKIVNHGVWSESLQLPGLQDLLRQLQQQRSAELERYDLDSTLTDIRVRVEEVVKVEREALRRMREHALTATPEMRAALEAVADKRQAALEALSPDTAEAVTQLAEQELVGEDARVAFDALLENLQRDVTQRQFRSLEQSIGALAGAALSDFKDMLRALDTQLRRRDDGLPSDFPGFMDRFGQYVPGARSLDDLLIQLQEQGKGTGALLNRVSSEMRRGLESTLQAVLRDPELGELLACIAEHVECVAPVALLRAYPFAGEQSVSLDEALRLMRRITDLDRLERDMARAQTTGNLSFVHPHVVGVLLGDAAALSLGQLHNIVPSLIDAGYVESTRTGIEITTRGMRSIGTHALEEIFGRLRHSTFGEHPITASGAGGDRTDDTKSYEYGDAFHLDLNRTVMNAVIRSGSGQPVHLGRDDFEVFRTEQVCRSATVLMLDMSRSMPLRGCFAAARKVTLALHSLIRTRFPRDVLYVVGFSGLAREIRPETLHRVSWGECVYGTNMQHGFMLARHLLGRYAHGTRQIILITDGEPTAHLEDNRVQFAYPPTERTFQETLREVRRCTVEGIVINTFMLDRSHYLTDFVTRMTHINHGRAFFATPDRLGDYILVDYVRTKQGTSTARR